MALREIYSDLSVTQLYDPATTTADQNSTSIDMQGYDSLLLVANVGASGDTLSGSVKIEFEVEESSDDSTFTDVADADLTNSVTGTNTGTFALVDDPAEDDAVYITGYKGTERYVRVVINVTGTHTNGTPISITAIRGHAHQRPVN